MLTLKRKMLKKHLNILLSVWLISAIVCFHATNPENNTCEHFQFSNNSCYAGNTLFDLAYQCLSSDAHHDGKHHHHIKYQKRFLTSRTVDFTIQVPATQEFTANILPQNLFSFPGKQWLNKVFLPVHHHFLFRLTPF